jgi:hypothetical protein
MSLSVKDASALLGVAPRTMYSLAAPVAAEPSAETMARKFYETYERLAPAFGYATRDETKRFDPELPNGRLMIATCTALAAALPVEPKGEGL